MGNYEIKAFQAHVQKLIKENQIDNGNSIIETDNGELATLLSATGKSDVKDLLNNVDLSSYRTNTESNKFLKDYIEATAFAKGIQIPENAKIEVSNFSTERARELYSGNAAKGILGISNEKYWNDITYFVKKMVKSDASEKSVEDFCKEKGLTAKETEEVMHLYYLNNVRKNVFGARVKDMSKFFSQSKNEVEARIAKSNISEEEKNQILKSKDFLDNYYKINLKVGDKTYNLLNLSDEDKVTLNKEFQNNPQFVNFLNEMQPDLKKQTLHFAQREALNEELSDSGQASRWLSAPLLAVLGFGVAKGFKDAKELNASVAKSKAFVDFIQSNPEKGHAILNKCAAKLNKLSQNGTKYLDSGELVGSDVIKRYFKRIGLEGGEFLVKQKAIHSAGLKAWVNPLKALKSAKGGALLGLIGMIAALSLDDCMGSFKDFFQDQNNFGTGKGALFMVAGIAGGIASSAAVVPSLNSIVNYRIADNVLKKANLLPKMSTAAKILSKGKWALLGLPLGLILTSSSSGSSWTSMALTRLQFGRNGKKLEEKGLIDKKDNTFKASNENMMEYEAYKGKWKGITTGATGDWTIGSIGGVTGVFMHANPLIQVPATVIQGCSETVTACIYQLLGKTQRDNKLEKEKDALVASIKLDNKTSVDKYAKEESKAEKTEDKNKYAFVKQTSNTDKPKTKQKQAA